MSAFVDLHRYIAYSVPTGWALLALTSLVTYVFNRDPGEWYWRLLAVLQVILGIQIIVGGTLFLTGHRAPGISFPGSHYVYGSLFPLIVLFFAHRYARRQTRVAVAIFGVAAFLCFGLTMRALQTGLGENLWPFGP
jgi:energy-coupling factor transporter transmembrane protein EcfT